MDNDERKELINAVETINAEYIALINSREYQLGRRLINIINDIKHFRVDKIVVRCFRFIRKKSADSILIKKEQSKDNMHNKTDELNALSNTSVTVYTCVTGGYDNIQPIIYHTPGFKYILITDNPKIKPAGWEVISIPNYIIEMQLSNANINRYIKMHPKELFPDNDYTIYIDGKVQIISDLKELLLHTKCYYGIAMHRHRFRDDIYSEAQACIAYKKGDSNNIKKQMSKYKKEGMPEHFGMCEAAVIVCDLKNENAQKLLDSWWKEYLASNSGRDQLAFPYLIWKKHRSITDIGNLGDNIETNPKFRMVGLHNG